MNQSAPIGVRTSCYYTSIGGDGGRVALFAVKPVAQMRRVDAGTGPSFALFTKLTGSTQVFETILVSFTLAIDLEIMCCMHRYIDFNPVCRR
mmetsp:Transcript_27134/g.74409  ORF Transcript_27134/g.74409 Transcript_27134/m.74409 type:complete len:92 (+) Transcript_27134:112-387(+)